MKKVVVKLLPWDQVTNANMGVLIYYTTKMLGSVMLRDAWCHCPRMQWRICYCFIQSVYLCFCQMCVHLCKTTLMIPNLAMLLA